MNMNRYTNAELADIHFICGLANGNGRAAVLFWGKKSNEEATESSNVRYQNLEVHRSFTVTIEGTRRPRIARTPIFEDGVLHAVNREIPVSCRCNRKILSNCPSFT
ncbi:hypothetical protein TNCV_2996661 [Trichonephila clavipes]|nr:hypothetical protein TNCV_2996661 [Trichonephila clavipes]